MQDSLNALLHEVSEGRADADAPRRRTRRQKAHSGARDGIPGASSSSSSSSSTSAQKEVMAPITDVGEEGDRRHPRRRRLRDDSRQRAGTDADHRVGGQESRHHRSRRLALACDAKPAMIAAAAPATKPGAPASSGRRDGTSADQAADAVTSAIVRSEDAAAVRATSFSPPRLLRSLSAARSSAIGRTRRRRRRAAGPRDRRRT